MKTEEIEILQASYQGNVEKVKELLSKNAALAKTIDFKGEKWEEGTSALTLACCNGSIDTVRLLVETGANKEITDHTGQKPIHWAGRYNQSDLIEILK